MSLLDQNWGGFGSTDDEALDDNQHGRQVNLIHSIIHFKKRI